MNMKLGTRGSKLALIQAEQVRSALQIAGIEAEIITHSTSGDRNRSSPIYRMNSVGVFVEELNALVESGTLDFAVHSAKDIPSFMSEALEVSAVLPRASYNDVLVSESNLFSLKEGAVIGTSSRRRISELHTLRKDIAVKDIRGNIDTRLEKLRTGLYDGIIIAKAAMDRMNAQANYFVLNESDFVPAPNQGIIAIVSRKGAGEFDILRKINDPATYDAFRFERELVVKLKLGCSVPAGILCTGSSGSYRLTARFYSLHSDEYRNYTENVTSLSDIDMLADEIRKSLPRSFGYGFGV